VQFVMGVKNAMPVDREVFEFYVRTLRRLAPHATWTAQAMAHVPPQRIYPCTNCGMVPLSRDVARGKLAALAAGAALVRAELAGS